MEKILCLLHLDQENALPKSAFEILGASQELANKLSGSTLSLGIIGKDFSKVAESLSGVPAADVFGVQGEAFKDPRYGTDALAAEALIKQSAATIILAPSGSRFNRCLPGVSQRLGGKIETKITGLRTEGDKIVAERWYYRQRMMASLTRSARPWILLVESGVFTPWKPVSGTKVNVKEVKVNLSDSVQRTKPLGIVAPSANTQTIRPDAPLLFVAGAGWTKKQSDGQPHIKEAENLILGFLNKSQASLGSSKSLVDQSGEGAEVLGFMSHLNQVGQTGSTPRHPKGLSTCCHGEEPHVVGWRFVNERRAVNLDANCGWAHGKADVLYVADAFKVMEKVNQLLGQA